MSGNKNLTKEIEEVVIELRRLRKIKLPDAIIAATTSCFGLELLTRDQHLLSVSVSSLRFRRAINSAPFLLISSI